MSGAPADEEKPAPKLDRRTWDKDAYARKALERLAALEAGEDPDKVEPEDAGIFREAPAELPRVPGSQRAFLQTREKGLNFDSKLGVKTISGDDAIKAGGYFCPVCECTLKDSASYLDHINGKRHQRRLGFSMRVQHSTLEQVQNRLQMHKQKRDRESATVSAEEVRAKAIADYEVKMRRMAEEEEDRKRSKREHKKAKKEDEKAAVAAAEAEAFGGGDEEDQEAMMAAMGFAGFGGSKKN